MIIYLLNEQKYIAYVIENLKNQKITFVELVDRQDT